MKSTITIHYELGGYHRSATAPVYGNDRMTVESLIAQVERTEGLPIIVQSVKKHTVTETDLAGILRDSVN